MSQARLAAIGKASRNERLKLRATSANAIGLAFGGVGFIQPIVAGDLTIVAVGKVAICAVIGYVSMTTRCRSSAAWRIRWTAGSNSF